jgi:hypothetical protein
LAIGLKEWKGWRWEHFDIYFLSFNNPLWSDVLIIVPPIEHFSLDYSQQLENLKVLQLQQNFIGRIEDLNLRMLVRRATHT